jgi:hypothetical protein
MVQEKHIQENSVTGILAVAGKKMTHCAKVAQHKRHSHEGPSVAQGQLKNQTWNNLQEESGKDGCIE